MKTEAKSGGKTKKDLSGNSPSVSVLLGYGFQGDQSCSPMAAVCRCQGEVPHRGEFSQERMNRFPERAHTFPVYDSYFEQSFSAAEFEVVWDEFFDLPRMKSVKIQLAIDG